MEKSNSRPVKQEWDTEFSTYFWQIHLDGNHAYNNTPMLTGYSKMRNQSEAQDKEYLLKRKIAMLYKRGYFERMKRVDFFTRTEDIMDKNKAVKILMCFPKHYDIPELNHDVIFKIYGPWLKQFYDCVNSGKSIDEIIPAVRKGTDKDHFINPELHHFKSVSHLYAHATRLLRHGHAQGAVESFIRKVKEKNGW